MTTIKLEVGESYRTRMGDIVTIKTAIDKLSSRAAYEADYRFMDSVGIPYTEDGFIERNRGKNPFDAIEKIERSPSLWQRLWGSRLPSI